MPNESCPWPPVPGLDWLCQVGYGWRVAFKGFCAGREAGESKKKEENPPGAAPAVEVFSPALGRGLGMLVLVGVRVAPPHSLPLAGGSGIFLWPAHKSGFVPVGLRHVAWTAHG